MKVRIGGVRQDVNSPGDLQKLKATIANTIVDGVVSEALEVTPRVLRRLKERVQVAATMEANKIFDVIADTIGKRRQAINTQNLTADDLMKGVPRDSVPMSGGYYVPWPELSYRYARWKGKKRPGAEYQMFRLTGAMRTYFARQGPTIIRNRLGGMEVNVDETFKRAYVSGGNYKLVKRELVDEGDVAKIVMGRVTLTMFPRLSPAMAPMLATRRWTDGGDGTLERSVFGGTKTAAKLMNRRNKFRPLVTPTLQFFMLNRIPAAVNRSMRDYFRRTSIGAE